jgi:hypothetical protein
LIIVEYWDGMIWRVVMAKILMIEMKPSENSNLLQDFLNSFITRKKTPIKMDPENREKEEILENLNRAKRDLDVANANFEFAQDEGLVDYYIYEIKAAETKYQYLLKKAREKNINVTNFENVHIWNRNKKI